MAKTTVQQSKKEQTEKEVKPANKRGKTKSQPAKRETSPKKKKPTKKAAKPKGISAAEERKLKGYFNEYMKLTVKELKEVLTANSQFKSGNKEELAAKCADGKLLGSIPLCPSCGGGRPRFDKSTKTYKCNGYMDDDCFRNCHKVFEFDEIQRKEWVEP